MKKYIVEMIGTMVLVLMGCGSAAIAANPGADASGLGIAFAGVALAFGLSVFVMVYAIGGISGCHINPAISFAMWINRSLSTKDMCMYWLFQVIGAFIGIGILATIVGHGEGLAVNAVDPYHLGYSTGQALLTETVMTFIFLMVIFGSTSIKSPSGFAGAAIGLCLTMIHLVSIPVTNTSVNPARSIAPAVLDMNVHNGLSDLWVFIVGPLLGAAIAAFVWRYISSGKEGN
ncbi:MAG: MIP family channel protein [Candidatus Azobacteroides sp.]|nr:MIP family channel protein [Candidatus Azobacteroides sp.]